ncbi:MAG: SDR family oxidoreductase [Bacteroidia bacterium]|nr:SDR family oxidoreductase [Bacteroidia bacterium]
MTVLITGATAGFGKATALLFAEKGYDLIITGRRNEKLQEMKNEIHTSTGLSVTKPKVLTLCFDIRKLEEVKKAVESIPEEFKKIDILVNNAGLAAGASLLHEGNIDDWERMIDTNIKGLLYMTRMIAPLMVKEKKGHIINVGSVAGKEVYPNGNVYCATKFAVDALNKAMRIELVAYGIKVGSINPGMAETEFSIVRFAGDEERAKKVYEGITPLSAADIAETIYWMASRPAHVNINDIVIMATAQASTTIAVRNT